MRVRNKRISLAYITVNVDTLKSSGISRWDFVTGSSKAEGKVSWIFFSSWIISEGGNTLVCIKPFKAELTMAWRLWVSEIRSCSGDSVKEWVSGGSGGSEFGFSGFLGGSRRRHARNQSCEIDYARRLFWWRRRSYDGHCDCTCG